MKKLCALFLCFLTLAAATEVYGQKKKSLEDEYEVQFIRTGVEGTILFKIFCYGKNEKDCIANAKRNAVKAVIFNGIPGSDMQKPMITDAGAAEMHRDYFKAFFNNKYLSYVALSTDGSIDSNDRFRVGRNVKVGIAVVVQKNALRRELEAAGVLRKLGDGF